MCRKLFVAHFISWLCFVNGYNHWYSDEKLLRNKLFNSKYDPYVRPVKDVRTVVNVTIDISVHHIIDLNEKFQFLQSQLWFRMYWVDEFLQWDKNNFNGLHHIQVTNKDIWTPDIEIYNEVGLEGQDPRERFPVTIEHNGRCNWRFPKILQSGCKMNISNFPNDHQVCHLDIGSWTLDSRFLKVQGHKGFGDHTEYRTNGEWIVTRIPSFDKFYTYVAWPDAGYHVVTFSINLERRPNYYYFHLIFPCILISFLNVCGFLLPVASNERMSMSVTTFLGLVVFLIVISDLMPPQADEVPIINVFFGLCIGMVSLAVVLNVFIIHLYMQTFRDERLHPLLHRIICHLGKLVFYKKLMSRTGFLDTKYSITKAQQMISSQKFRKVSDESIYTSNIQPTPVKTTSQDKTYIRDINQVIDTSCQQRHINIALGSQTNDTKPSPEKEYPNFLSAHELFMMDPGYQSEISGIFKNKTNKKLDQCYWIIVSYILDRFFFIFFGVFFFILTVFVMTFG